MLKMDEKWILSDFHLVGISYKKADTATRGKFSMSEGFYERLNSRRVEFGVQEYFVISTCNRVEIYGVASSRELLMQFLLTQTKGNEEEFLLFSYVKAGLDAVRHLFRVAAGLDSQILGDSEVIGQIRNSVKIAKVHFAIGAFLDRLLNTVFQSSKSIKNQTKLSSGGVSLSFSAVQLLNDIVPELSKKNIALIGAGSFGCSIGRSLVKPHHIRNLTIVNRTFAKAKALASEWKVNAASMEELSELVAYNDVLILATASPTPLVFKEHLIGTGKKVIIDLSVPANLDKEATTLTNVLYIGLDELCGFADTQLAYRQDEVSYAEAIIDGYIFDFLEWLEFRRYAPVLYTFCNKLRELQSICAQHTSGNRNAKTIEVQRLVNAAACRIKAGKYQGCQMLQTMHELIQLNS